MTTDLFSTKKIPFVLDTIAHSLERRKGGETKIVKITLRSEPFDAKLATSLDSRVRTTLFKLNHPDRADHLRAAEFELGLPRQIVTCYTTQDTEKPTIAFDQVKVAGVRVRTEKGVNAYALILQLAFGPVSKNELEYLERFRTEQRCLSFQAAEPSLDFAEEEQAEEDDNDEETAVERPQPMFDDPRDQELVGVGADVAKHRQQHKAHTHTTKKGKRR